MGKGTSAGSGAVVEVSARSTTKKAGVRNISKRPSSKGIYDQMRARGPATASSSRKRRNATVSQAVKDGVAQDIARLKKMGYTDKDLKRQW